MEKCLKEMINLARNQIHEITEFRDIPSEDMNDLFFLTHILEECLSKRAEVKKRKYTEG